MGVGSSTLILRNVEEGTSEQRLEEIIEKFAFFKRWSLKDVRFSLDAYGGLPHAFDRQPGEEVVALPRSLAGDLLGRQTSWADYYKITYETETLRRSADSERERRKWHCASFGFSMKVDATAKGELESYRMFLDDVPSPPPENFENPAHTDDEDDGEDGPEDLGPAARALEAGAPAPAPGDDGGEHGLLALVAAAAGAPGPAPSPEDTPEAAVAPEAVPPAEAPRSLPKKWDPTLRSPIFFGYEDVTVGQEAAAEKKALEAQNSKEDAVATAQRLKRTEAIEKYRGDCLARKQARDRKLKTLEEAHHKAARVRKANYTGRRQVCASILEKMELDKRFDADERAATAATDAEANRLHVHNLERESHEAQELEKMVLESLQIDGAESCTAPGGRRLELQARDGLRGGQRALDQACKDLEEAQEALELQRTDIPLPGDDLDGDDKDKGGIDFVAAMKSRVHEREGALRLALKNLDDAEAMLERAVLRRRKEDHILALFAALGAAEATGTSWDHRATEDPPYTQANTVDLAVGLTILCSDVLADRVRVLLRIFDYDGDGFLEQAEIVAALKCASRLLGGLGFLKRPAADLELDSVALRAIAEQRVATDGLGMTLYEAQDWLVHLVANSTFLSGLFNVKFAFGELSAYQRQKIPVVRLFELGLLPGQQKRAKFPTSKAHISAVFHSFWLIFGRAIICRNGLDARMIFFGTRACGTLTLKRR